MVGPLRSRAQWEVIRSKAPLEEITIVIMGPWLIVVVAIVVLRQGLIMYFRLALCKPRWPQTCSNSLASTITLHECTTIPSPD